MSFGRKKMSTTVYLNPEQVEALRLLSLSTQIPTAQLIRNAISEYLNKVSASGQVPPARPEDRRLPPGNKPTTELEAVVEKVLRRLLPASVGG